MLHLPRGGIFGFVLPQTFLSSKEGIETRRRMLNECDVMEITLFADKVFEFGEPESAIILGHKAPAIGRQRTLTRYQRVREKQVPIFKHSYEPSSRDEVDQHQFSQLLDADCTLPVLPELWSSLLSASKLQQNAFVGRGFSFRSKDDPLFEPGTVLQSKEKFPGSSAGHGSVNEVEYSHGKAEELWFNLSDKAVSTQRAGTAVGMPQVLLNHGRVSRTEWRLRAILDVEGHAVTGRVLMIRPPVDRLSLLCVWGIMNSPLANLYAYSRSGTRDVLLGDIQEMPFPANLSSHASKRIDRAVSAYLEAAHHFDQQRVGGRLVDAGDLFHAASPSSQTLEQAKQNLMYLHWRVDAEVLKLYDLPAHLERKLLDMFNGVERRGVPFYQTEYFPAHFTDLQRLEDLLAITGEWEQTSARKSELIEKKIRKQASDDELKELSRLKMLTEARGELFAPLPLPQLTAMKARLQSKGQWEGQS
jgi:hypothetical protein